MRSFPVGKFCVLLAGFWASVGIGGCTPPPLSPAEVIEQGVAAWNQWRADNPTLAPDLSGAALDGATLDGVNFNATNLSGATLRNVRLAGADLQQANLAAADLGGADLSGANLTGANLTGADLREGKLAGAILTNANVAGALLGGADLSGANVDAISNWRTIPDMRNANIYRIVKAPSGFKDFALENGARKED